MIATTCLIALVSTVAAAQPVPQPGATVRPWPVHIVDSDSHPAGQPPLIVVGSLFTGGHCFREDDAGTVHRTPAGQIVLPVRLTDNKYSKAMTEYLLGNIRPRPSCNEEETCVFVTSPPLNAYDEFRIDSIDQEGDTFTISASHWRDDSGEHWGPGPNHSAQMVRLGWLPAGDYKLILRLRDRYCTTGGKRPALYADQGVRIGQTTFTVTKSDAWQFHSWDQPASASIIREKDLSSPSKIPSLTQTDRATATLQQQPYFAYRTAPAPAPTAPPTETEPTATVTVTPSLDWHKHSQAAATLWMPVADAKAPATLVARITGGTRQILGKYDWAEINAVEWKGSTVTIHASIWRKPYIYGNDKVRNIPEFAVPLESDGQDPDPAKAAAAIKVNVIWHEGIDNPHNAVEEVRH